MQGTQQDSLSQRLLCGRGQFDGDFVAGQISLNLLQYGYHPITGELPPPVKDVSTIHFCSKCSLRFSKVYDSQNANKCLRFSKVYDSWTWPIWNVYDSQKSTILFQNCCKISCSRKFPKFSRLRRVWCFRCLYNYIMLVRKHLWRHSAPQAKILNFYILKNTFPIVKINRNTREILKISRLRRAVWGMCQRGDPLSHLMVEYSNPPLLTNPGIRRGGLLGGGVTKCNSSDLLKLDWAPMGNDLPRPVRKTQTAQTLQVPNDSRNPIKLTRFCF